MLFFFLIVTGLVFSANAQQCLNGGTPLNATNCQCPAFVGGKLCETVKCQRFGVPDKNRCSCPPGWYDKYCGIRGCRPPNEDNLDLTKRSVIIVFNMKTTMKDQLDALRTNFKTMVSSMRMDWNDQNRTTDWVENYIVYGFVQTTSQLKLNLTLVNTADEVVTFLDSLVLQEGNANQPVLTAVQNAQQTYPRMKSNAIVLVFTDSPASDATTWSHRVQDRTPEHSCLQISFLWKSKVSFILSLPSGTDISNDSVDVYRRLSLTTHGDYFHVSGKSETSDILLNVISTYFFPENVAVGFGLNDYVYLITTPDNDDDWVFTLLTKDPNPEYKLPDVNGSVCLAHGDNYKLFVGKGNLFIKPTGDPFNFRTFLQSKNTILFDYNDDIMIDVGSGIVNIGIDMRSTARTFGFAENYDNMTFHVIQTNGSLVREDFKASKRAQLDCTFELAFDPWVNTDECPPGPITQVHVINYPGFYKSRVTPGYCDELAHYSHQIEGLVLPSPLKLDVTPVESCSVTNIDAINDPRLEAANQFIFILEQHSNNRDVYNLLASEIDRIIALTDSTTNTGSYKKELSLIVNNDETSRVLLSAYNPDVFIERFRSLVIGMSLKSLTNPHGLFSIVQAQKINIRPSAQVFYFTNQAVKTVQNSTRPWDIVNRDTEVNFFTIADGVTTEIFALPSQLELIQKMSNGRLIPLASAQNSLVNLFANIIPMNALTTDREKYDCHTAPFTLDAFVEKETQQTVFEFVGTGLYGISIKDAAGLTVPLSQYTSFQNANFKSLRINTTNYTPGTWKVSISTTRGGCQLTVRHQTSNGVILGFSSTSDSDVVNSQIPLQRTSATPREQIYVPIRIRQASNSKTPTIFNLEIQSVNRSRYDLPQSFLNTTVLQRDSSKCSYNLITPKIQTPTSALSTWTLTSYDNDGNLILHRIFYYYQHYPSDTAVCHGNEVDVYGQCVCPPNYTGEYCWDRICAPGATLSNGICSCSSGFYGEFCELELMMANATTSPSTSSARPPTTPTIQSTTSSSANLFYLPVLLGILGLQLAFK